MTARATADARYQGVKSARDPAAISDVPAATPSSDWPRHAPNSAWHSGTISEVVSASLVSQSSRHCQPSSDVDRSQPEAAKCPRFCRYYEIAEEGFQQSALSSRAFS